MDIENNANENKIERIHRHEDFKAAYLISENLVDHVVWNEVVMIRWWQLQDLPQYFCC